MKKLLIFSLGLVLLLSSCKRDEDDVVDIPDPVVSSGMVVACEGSFNQNNASLHWLGDDGSVRNNLFQSANGVPIGDVLQNYREFNGRGYAVVNNSQKVEVINPTTFESIGTIIGFDYPRDILVVDSSKGYITNGSMAGDVLTFNPGNNSITGAIPAGNGPEEMTYNGSFVFVANSGGWLQDNTVTVINPINDEVVATVTVGDRPVALEVDYQNNVWVLCAGAIEYDENWNIVNETDARLMRIDGTAHAVTADITIGQNGDHPSHMAINADGTQLYVVNGGLLTVGVNSGTVSEGPVEIGNYRAIGVHPSTGEIYLSSAPDYVSNDVVYVYSAQGELRETLNVGIAPIAMQFMN